MTLFSRSKAVQVVGGTGGNSIEFRSDANTAARRTHENGGPPILVPSVEAAFSRQRAKTGWHFDSLYCGVNPVPAPFPKPESLARSSQKLSPPHENVRTSNRLNRGVKAA